MRLSAEECRAAIKIQPHEQVATDWRVLKFLLSELDICPGDHEYFTLYSAFCVIWNLLNSAHRPLRTAEEIP